MGEKRVEAKGQGHSHSHSHSQIRKSTWKVSEERRKVEPKEVAAARNFESGE